MAADIRISFIVLSFQSSRVLERCIRSLVAQRDAAAGDEIWIVENGSSDGSPAIARALEREFPGIVRTIFLERNVGTTVSRNLAMRQAAGRYLAIVDSDIDAPPGLAASLIRHLEAHPGAGLIAPRLLYPDGRLQLSVDRFPTVAHKVRRYVSLRSMERRLNGGGMPARIVEVDYAISAFWLLTRAAADRVGPLDEEIFYAPEDVDYCVRIWKAGYAVLYDPTVHAIHDAQEISRVAPWKRMARSHAAGLVYLFRKHRYCLGRRRLYRTIRRARTAAGHVPAGTP